MEKYKKSKNIPIYFTIKNLTDIVNLLKIFQFIFWKILGRSIDFCSVWVYNRHMI